MAFLTYASTRQLFLARVTAHADWPLTVGTGLAASAALIAFSVVAYRRAGRHSTSLSPLAAGVIFGIGALYPGGMIYARPAVMPEAGPPETVTTAFQLGVIAFTVPAYLGIIMLPGWTWRKLASTWRLPAGRHSRADQTRS